LKNDLRDRGQEEASMEERKYKGVLNKPLMNKIASNLVSNWQRRLALGATGIAIMFAVFFMIKGYPNPAMVLAVGALLFALEFILISRSTAKKVLNRTIRQIGSDEYTVILENNAIRVRGYRSKNYLRIKYNDILDIWEKPEAFFLYTSDLAVIAIDKTEMTAAEIGQVRVFLDGHCISMAMRRNKMKSL
jgi:hypothetical protein